MSSNEFSTPDAVNPPEVEREPSWQEWYANAVEKRGVDVEDVALENEDWHVVEDGDGRVREIVHKDGLFFRVTGKDAGFYQPFIEPVVDPDDPEGRQGAVVLFVDEKTGDMLLEAQFETGSKSPRGVSIRPTIQASYSNIRRNGYPFSEIFLSDNIPQFSEKLRQQGGTVRNEQIDPGRIGNFNLYGLLPVNRASIDLSSKPFHRWISQDELNEIRQHQSDEGDREKAKSAIDELLSAVGGGDFEKVWSEVQESRNLKSANDAKPLLTNQFSVTNEMRLEWLLNKKE